MVEIWSPRAERHLQSIFEFISKDSVSAAERTLAKIFASVDQIKTHPNLGRAGRVLGTREIVVPQTPYFVVYQVKQGAVELIAVLHGRQEWPPKV